MCFPKSKPEFTAYYDEEDGSVNEENSNDVLVIPDDVHHHVDSVFLNFQVESQDGILAFIYEAGNEVFIVWTSDEAIELVYEPFSEFSECSEFELF